MILFWAATGSYPRPKRVLNVRSDSRVEGNLAEYAMTLESAMGRLAPALLSSARSWRRSPTSLSPACSRRKWRRLQTTSRSETDRGGMRDSIGVRYPMYIRRLQLDHKATRRAVLANEYSLS